MAGRKTVDVSTILAAGNAALAAEGNTIEFRTGVAFMLETVLFESKTYRGFRYLELDEQNLQVQRPQDPSRRRYL
jgi:hypothetical protein